MSAPDKGKPVARPARKATGTRANWIKRMLIWDSIKPHIQRHSGQPGCRTGEQELPNTSSGTTDLLYTSLRRIGAVGHQHPSQSTKANPAKAGDAKPKS